MLFTEYERTSTEAKTRKLSAFEFLDKSAWEISSLMRAHLNDWTINFKDDPEFLNRFRSKDDKQHYAASFELMVYEIFKRAKFKIEKHPDTSTGKRPDFRISKDSDLVFVSECTLAGHSYAPSSEKNLKEMVEEMIDDLEYFPYFVNIDFKKVSPTTISKRKLLAFIQRMQTKREGIPNEFLFTIEDKYEESGWVLHLSLLRKSSPDIKRSLGIVTDKAKIIDTAKPIITSLNDKKASKYGMTDCPYVICLNTDDLFTSETCFSQALFGSYSADELSLNNSFFYSDGLWRNTKVSAVIVFRNFDIFTLDTTQITVWHNPSAKNPIKPLSLPFTEYSFIPEANVLQRKVFEKRIDIFELLAIDKIQYLQVKTAKR